MSSDGHWGLWAQGLVSRLWKVGIVGTSRWHLGRQPLFPALQLASPTLRARTRPHHSLGPSPPPHGLRSWHILAQSQDHPVAFPHLAGVGPGDRPGLAGRLRECVLIEELDQDHDFIRDTMPLAKRCRLQPRDASKMPESAWKFLFYLGSWSYTSYLLFGTDYPFFRDPPSVFYDWTPGMVVPRDIAAAYLLQGSFYGHSLYATLYMDTWRKDSVVMLVHHVVTLVLIVSSYAFRPQGPSCEHNRCTQMFGARCGHRGAFPMGPIQTSSVPCTTTWASLWSSCTISVTCCSSSPSSTSTSNPEAAPTTGCMPWRPTWAAWASASAGSGSASTGSLSRSCMPRSTAACAPCLTSPSTSSSTRCCCCSPS
ncbi:ceramide synthase 1 isoform X3 [Lemur catta]|uniref:ceramide synthase 1 isoform X3 n=1 Tax=Lemur catta TaxID=9447 RepID=UPI001E269741|nr:ceramide synthase 1 isoform X3 [Lemur catta]